MNWNRIGRLLTETAGNLTRAFGTIIVWCIVGTFVVISIVSILWKLEDTPIRSLEGAASQLPSRVFIDMLGMEVRQLPSDRQDSSFSSSNVTGFLTRLTTGIDLADPRSLAAQMLPGAPHGEYIMLVRGIDTQAHEYPLEIPPSPDLNHHGAPMPGDGTGQGTAPGTGAGDGVGTGVGSGTGAGTGAGSGTGSGSGDSTGDGAGSGTGSGEGSGSESGAGPGTGSGAGSGSGDQPGTGKSGKPNPSHPGTPPVADLSKKVAFIYHSHNSESYLPELDGETEPNRAFSPKDSSITITAVGKYLEEALAAKGIGALHSDTPYGWNTAYTESRKTVKATMQKNAELRFILDLHRDAARRDKTTLTKDGKTYAKLWFVIGKKNPQFEKNFEFAEELNRRVDEKLPGISRGIVEKREGSNGEFNQSLSPYSVIIEVGGVDNTLEETYRTMDILAEAIAEMYWENSETEKADAKPEPVQANRSPSGQG